AALVDAPTKLKVIGGRVQLILVSVPITSAAQPAILDPQSSKDYAMPRSRKIGVETRFLVPLREDRHLGQRRLHPTTRWQWLERQLRLRFGGFSVSGATM